MKTKLLKHFSLRATMLVALVCAAFTGAWADTFEKVTSTSDLEINAEYAIVYEGDSKALGAITGTSTKYGLAVAITISNNKFESVEGLSVLTLSGGSSTGYLLNSSLDNNYLSWSSGNSLITDGSDYRWTITFESNNVIIKSKDDNSRKLQYNSGSPRFACYTSAQKDIQLYKKITTPAGGVVAPTFSLASGAVTAGTTVTLTQDEAAMIMYTTDGSDPDNENNKGVVYSEPITITSPVTIKAIAIDDADNVSSVASASYTIDVAAPTFSVEAGKVEAGTSLTLSATGENTILYTTDGTTPSWENSNGEVYSTPIVLNEAVTVKAIAVDAYENESEVVSASYTIGIPTQSVIDLQGVTTGLTFNAGDFTPSGSGYKSYSKVTYTGSNSVEYSGWELTDVMHSNANMQMKASSGKITLPSIKTDAGFTISVNATTNSVTISDGTKSGTNTLSVSTTNANITISAGSKYAVISTITITPNVVSSVATPVITLAAGTYEEVQTTTISCETDGATIYYTTDGSEPTAQSTEYTSAITIDESMTIKAIAINGEDKSAVASATYTINLPFTTIAEVKELSSGDNFKLNISGAQIVYFDGGKNMYVRDASGAILFYNSSSFSTDLKTGDILSGTVTGTYKPYNGLPEVTNSDISGLTATGNETVIAKTIDGTTTAIEANLCDLVKIEATEISESNSKYYIGENQGIQLYDGLHVGNLTFTDGATADISGIATVYNTTYELFPRFESDIVYLDNSVAVSITDASGYATFCSDKALDFTGADAFEVYIATTNDDASRVTLKQIQKVPANTGVLLHSAAGGAVEETNIPVLDGDADDVEGNLFVPATTEIASLASEAGGKKNFILSKVDGVVGFFKANGKKVAAGKAYIQVSADSPVKEFSLDGMTAVNAVKAAQSNSAWFNLAGQRVAQPTKGLYIVGGKKVIVK